MKNRRFLFAVIICGIAIAWLLTWRIKPIDQKTAPVPSHTSQDTIQPQSKQLKQGSTFAPTHRPVSEAEKERRAKLEAIFAQSPDPAYARYYYEATKTDPQFDWKQPINLWGKVVDENDSPVSGASINFVWTDLSTEGTSKAQAITDSQGNFSLLNRTGKRLSAIAGKEGYYPTKSSSQSFEYANPYDGLFRPDRNHPVVFYLRKKGGAEPLWVVSKNYPVARDGTPVDIELREGKKVSSGDIRIECWTEDKNPNRPGNQHQYDWKCRVTIPGGGLTTLTNEFPFEAPTTGYTLSDEIDMPKEAEGWRSDVTRNYFIKLGSGMYGRLNFRMIAGGSHFFLIESSVNPTGSRNLEYDETVQPKQKVFE